MEIYYLSSLDSAEFEQTRECIFIKRLRFDTGKECALVKLSPPIIGQRYNLGSDIAEFILTPRHEGEGLSPIEVFPCFIFIARPLIVDIERYDEITKTDVEIVAWGELYRSRYDADNHVFA